MDVFYAMNFSSIRWIWSFVNDRQILVRHQSQVYTNYEHSVYLARKFSFIEIYLKTSECSFLIIFCLFFTIFQKTFLVSGESLNIKWTYVWVFSAFIKHYQIVFVDNVVLICVYCMLGAVSVYYIFRYPRMSF